MDAVDLEESHLECHYCEFLRSEKGDLCPVFKTAWTFFRGGVPVPYGIDLEKTQQEFSWEFSCILQKQKEVAGE